MGLACVASCHLQTCRSNRPTVITEESLAPGSVLAAKEEARERMLREEKTTKEMMVREKTFTKHKAGKTTSPR